MEFKGEGDISMLSDIQIKKLKEVLEEHGFGECTVHIEHVGKKGDNYTSFVKRIKVERNDDNKQLNMIAKVAPTNKDMRYVLSTEEIFRNEVVMYTEVLPKLVELQKEAGVPENEWIKYPTCYGIVHESPHELILLEDLTIKCFEMRNKMISLNDEEIKMALEKLASLHSVSMIFTQRHAKLFQDFKGKLYNIWSDARCPEHFKELENSALVLLDTDEHIRRLKGTLANINETAEILDKSDLNSASSLIIQGDCWTNNLMFRIEENKLTDCIMIDYQLSRSSSQAMDVMYLIFNCTDKITRSKYYFDWLDFYYNKFEASLTYFDLEANSVYPRYVFNTDLKRYGKLAFGIAVLLVLVLSRDVNESVEFLSEDFTMQNALNVNEATAMKMKKRILELCESFEEYEYVW